MSKTTVTQIPMALASQRAENPDKVCVATIKYLDGASKRTVRVHNFHSNKPNKMESRTRNIARALGGKSASVTYAWQKSAPGTSIDLRPVGQDGITAKALAATLKG